MRRLVAGLLIVLVVASIGVVGYFKLGTSDESGANNVVRISNSNMPSLSDESTYTSSTQTSSTTSVNSGNEGNVSDSGSVEVRFYIFGVSTCPHCQSLKSKIIRFYGRSSLVFYDLAEEEGVKKYGDAFDVLHNYTKTYGVPQTGIFVDGSLKAVIVGDFGTSDDFMDRVNYYISTVNKLINEDKHPYILVYSVDGAEFANDTKEIEVLTRVFLHPEEFIKKS